MYFLSHYKKQQYCQCIKGPAVEINYFEVLHVSLCQLHLQSVPDERKKIIRFLLHGPWKFCSVSRICSIFYTHSSHTLMSYWYIYWRFVMLAEIQQIINQRCLSRLEEYRYIWSFNQLKFHWEFTFFPPNFVEEKKVYQILKSLIGIFHSWKCACI